MRFEKTVSECVIATGPSPVDLSQAADFAILAKSGVLTVPNSNITGGVGLSPTASTFPTGSSLIADASGLFSTSAQVAGDLYAADFVTPAPSRLERAVVNMEAAYTNASGRIPNFTDIGAGDVGGLTLDTGVYKWTTGVNVTTDATILGGIVDHWIVQIPGTLTAASNITVILTGGTVARNIYWVIDSVRIGSGARFEGTVLAATDVTLETGDALNGRIYSQTAAIVTLPPL